MCYAKPIFVSEIAKLQLAAAKKSKQGFIFVIIHKTFDICRHPFAYKISININKLNFKCNVHSHDYT